VVRAEAVVSAIRGVAPTDEARYATAAAAGTFRCFSEAGAEGSPMASAALPASAVNDDFCDCLDGSDEPGTGACAGQKETLFYCPNKESLASYVYASRVNDGICDCCDGSDEWRTTGAGACPNNCKQEGDDFRRQLKQKEAEWDSGVTERQRLIQYAKRARENAQKELTQFREKLPTLEAEENATRVTLEDAVREKASAEPAAEPATETAAEPAAETTAEPETTAEAASEPVAAAATAATESTEAPVAGSEEEVAGVRAGAETAKEGAPVVSEYTKWMDGAEKVLPAAKPELETSEEAEEEAEEEVGDEEAVKETKGMFAATWDSLGTYFSAQWQRLFGKSMTPLERAHHNAEKAHNAAKDSAKEARTKIEELQRKVDSDDSDHNLAYDNLDGKCLTKKLDQYKYEACFYKTAKQDSTSIGTWKHWESTHVGFFDDGQDCPGGLPRTLRVRFGCGSTEEILEISEPSRCTYEAKATHPAACVGVSPAEAHKKVRMPTEEL